MKKKYLLIIIALIIIGIACYAYLEFNRKVKPMEQSKADVTIEADSLVKAFTSNEQLANQQFLNKILRVTGRVSTIEKTDSSSVLIFTLPAGSIRCYLSTTLQENNNYTEKIINIKGLCTGFNADDLGIGADVIITRAIIEN